MKIVDRWLARMVIRIKKEIERYEVIAMDLPGHRAFMDEYRLNHPELNEVSDEHLSQLNLVPITLARPNDPSEPVTLAVYEDDQCCSVDLSPSMCRWLSKELYQS